MKTTLSILAVAFAASAIAGVTVGYEHTLKSRETKSYATAGFETVMSQRGDMLKKTAKAISTDNGKAKVIGAGGTEINFTDLYGDLELKLEEDFSLLTQGSEDEPNERVKLNLTQAQSIEQFGNAWYTFKAEYTHSPNWGVSSSYPAGGCLYMLTDDDQGHLNTPLVKLDDFSGIGVLEFKARNRMPGGKYDALLIEAAETNGMGKTWRFLESCIITDISNEWTTYRVLMTDCGPSTIFNIVMMDKGEIYLDDVKVYELKPFVGIPQIKAHSDYKGSSFTANWDAVEGAEYYLLSVYQYGADNERYYTLENEKVTGTSHEVKDVESGEIYFYSVVAVKDNKASLPSNEHRVFDLEIPKMQPVEVTGDHSYKASWDYVPGADVFNYFAFNKRVAEEDGLFVVTDEKFDGLTDAEGYPTGLTKEDPAFECYDVFYPIQMKQQGWKGTNSYAYDDYVSLDAYFYETGQSDSGFISPEMDFSKDGGKFTLKVDLAGETSYVTDENDKVYSYTTQTCVALFNYNEELGDYEQVELVYPDTKVTEDFKTFEFKLTKGSARSKVGIYAIQSYGNLYLDNILITQNYKSGESLIEPFKFERWHGRFADDDPYTIEVDVPDYASGMEVYHQVSSYGRIVISEMYGQKQYEDRESKYTDREYVCTTKKYSGINNVQLNEGKIKIENGVVSIQNPLGNTVTICDVNGAVLLRSKSTTVDFKLPSRGVYVVNGRKVIY